MIVCDWCRSDSDVQVVSFDFKRAGLGNTKPGTKELCNVCRIACAKAITQTAIERRKAGSGEVEDNDSSA